jgi:hypothetical protein
MQTADPDEQLEVFPQIFVMFAYEENYNHTRYGAQSSTEEGGYSFNPKAVVDRINKFIEKSYDIFRYKEVAVTKPFRMNYSN